MHGPMGFNLRGYVATIISGILILGNMNLTNMHTGYLFPRTMNIQS